eukprot:scaffold16341_cov57-Phaeocystis_antarctica.AAC.3
MSVMAETSQSAMRPYVAMAAVVSALYAWTAVFRAAVVVNVAGQLVGGGQGGCRVEHGLHVCDAGGVKAQRLVERRRNVEHVAHVCDAGRVEAQRLVERQRASEHVAHARDAGGVEAQRLVERPRVVEHVLHVRDAGRVEAQRLVEDRRALEHVLHVRDARGVEAQRLVERQRAAEHAVHVRDAGGVEAQGLVERRRSVEQVAHVRDAGGIEAQRLAERRRLLPRVERRAYSAGRGSGREAAGGRRPRRTQRGTGSEAHVEHLLHGCDAGGVEAQQLVERQRALPRVERRAHGAGRGAAGREEGDGGRRPKQRVQGRA